MKAAISLLCLFSLIFAGAALAQTAKPGTGAAGGGGASSTTSTRPAAQPADPSTLINRDWEKLRQQGRGGDRLTGNVDVSGGAVPWDPIAVTVMCDGKPKYTTNTDAKGLFAINSVDDRGPNTVKADPKPVGWQYVGCSVQAALPGFNSSTLPVGDRHVMDSANLGTIHLTREENSGGSAVSTTTASAPKDATKAFDRARAAFLEGKPDKAEKELQKAVQVYPQFAEAWYQLGRLQEIGNSPEAYGSFWKAAAADPNYVLPHQHMALLAANAQKWQEVVDQTKKALELDPRGNVHVWYYSALGNVQLKNMDVAEISAKKALAMDPLHEEPNTEQLLAVVLASKQDYSGALEHLKSCLTYFPPGPNLDLVKEQIAQLEPAAKAAQK